MFAKGLATVLAVTVLVQISFGLPAPQFLTLRDGKFGVSFGGYHAEAGLGGFLTGNSAHGGLAASAGTPHGQQAGAGLGGILDGNARTTGGLYAGATAGNGVGASAALGGGLDGEGGAGGSGAEAHAGGVSKKVVKLSQTNGAHPPSETVFVHEEPLAPQTVNTRFNNQEHDSRFKTKTVVKEVHTDLQAPPANQQPTQTYTKTIYKKKFIGHPHKVAVVDSSVDQGTYQGGSASGNIDLNRFFDFQAFTNIASSFAHPAPQQGQSSTTFLDQGLHQGEGGYEIQNEVNTRLDSNGHSSGGSTQTTVGTGYTNNPNFWNDIFNIPISALNAVNQLLNNNKAATSGVQVHKRTEVN